MDTHLIGLSIICALMASFSMFSLLFEKNWINSPDF